MADVDQPAVADGELKLHQVLVVKLSSETNTGAAGRRDIEGQEATAIAPHHGRPIPTPPTAPSSARRIPPSASIGPQPLLPPRPDD